MVATQWCMVMILACPLHSQWWQSGSAIRDVATCSAHGMRGVRLGKRTSVCVASSRRRDPRSLTATTEHGPWGGTNNGHPTMILTGMTHAHYQPALHPPPSDLGEF